MASLLSSLTSIFCQLRNPTRQVAGDTRLTYLPLARGSLAASTRCTSRRGIRLTIDRLSIDEQASLLCKTSGNRVYWVEELGSIARRPLKRPRAIISRWSSPSLSFFLEAIDGGAKEPSYRFKSLFRNVRRRRVSLKRGYSHTGTSNFSASH